MSQAKNKTLKKKKEADNAQNEQKDFQNRPIAFYRQAEPQIQSCKRFPTTTLSIAIINPRDPSLNHYLLNFLHAMDQITTPTRRQRRKAELLKMFDIMRDDIEIAKSLIEYPFESIQTSEGFEQMEKLFFNFHLLNFVNQMLKLADSCVTGYLKAMVQDFFNFISLANSKRQLQKQQNQFYIPQGIKEDYWEKLGKLEGQNILLGSFIIAQQNQVKDGRVIKILVKKEAKKMIRDIDILTFGLIADENKNTSILFHPLSMFKVRKVKEDTIWLDYCPTENNKIEELRKIHISQNPQFFHIARIDRDFSHKTERKYYLDRRMKCSQGQVDKDKVEMQLVMISTEQTIKTELAYHFAKSILLDFDNDMSDDNIYLKAMVGRSAYDIRNFEEAIKKYEEVLAFFSDRRTTKSIPLIIESRCMIANSYLESSTRKQRQVLEGQLGLMKKCEQMIEEVSESYVLSLDLERVKVINIIAKLYIKLEMHSEFESVMEKGEKYIEGEDEQICSYERIRLWKTRAQYLIKRERNNEAIEIMNRIVDMKQKMKWSSNQNVLRFFSYNISLGIRGYLKTITQDDKGVGEMVTADREIQQLLKQQQNLDERKLMQDIGGLCDGQRGWEYAEFLYLMGKTFEKQRRFGQALKKFNQAIQMFIKFNGQIQKVKEIEEHKNKCEMVSKWEKQM